LPYDFYHAALFLSVTNGIEGEMFVINSLYFTKRFDDLGNSSKRNHRS
jgi:hypothetical protein